MKRLVAAVWDVMVPNVEFTGFREIFLRPCKRKLDAFWP
jgi:hypothetical protein